ncbi:uncharacterized protein LOC127812143 [Diospyros lotus]|uniref:uncharacterized protein LOC127812143 n=1 Tax=Diospyros lotus TaxID=55363 RepID=UPI002257AB8B|nr:uncharacterized protein LOC127812143 [Diospyros lotus]
MFRACYERSTPPNHPSSMAGAHCATTAVFPLSQPPKTTLITVSFISSPTPPKRKNYLRQKLLKTLTKPYPNDAIPESPPPTNPIIPAVSPREHNEGEARQGFEVSRPSETAGVLNGGFGFGYPSTRSVFKLGLFLVGAFAFQTVCAVMVFGSADSDRKDGNLGTGHRTRVLELGVNGDSKGKSSALLDGNGDLFSGKLEEKIYEIQAMAREARERDRLDSKSSGLEDDDDFVKTGIEKEVERKLVKLRKRLQNSREKLPVFPVSHLGNEDEFEDGVGVDSLDENKPLMFRKKYKFRSPSTNPSIKPKGFQGSQNQTITRSKNSSSAVEDELMRKGSADNDNVDLLGEGWLPEQENNNLSDDVSVPLLLEEDIGRNLSKGKSKSAQTSSNKLGTERVAKPKERGIGATRQAGDKGSRNSWSQKSRKSSPIGSRNSWSQTKKVQAATIISNERDSFMRNDTLKSREGRSKGATRKVEGKQSDDKAHKWWLSLPYVFAILMHTDHDGEGPKGLFTVKTNSYTMDKDGLSYTVTFEDRGDATNFCYLLQSFFEDLHDFSAEIVPLSIQELDEAVRSCTMKVIVVKKGQLKLYAGQPLAEVELALWSLVERS